MLSHANARWSSCHDSPVFDLSDALRRIPTRRRGALHEGVLENRTKAAVLLRLLSFLGIDASTADHGYTGVARAIRERLLHPQAALVRVSIRPGARQLYRNAWRRLR